MHLKDASELSLQIMYWTLIVALLISTSSNLYLFKNKDLKNKAIELKQLMESILHKLDEIKDIVDGLASKADFEGILDRMISITQTLNKGKDDKKK